VAAGMRLAGRVVGGLLGLVAGKLIVDKLKEQRASAAVHELYQLLASKSDPGSLTADEVCDAARPLFVTTDLLHAFALVKLGSASLLSS